MPGGSLDAAHLPVFHTMTQTCPGNPDWPGISVHEVKKKKKNVYRGEHSTPGFVFVFDNILYQQQIFLPQKEILIAM